MQLQGYRDAAAWLATERGVDADKIGPWGSSFSDSEVIILASEEPPIRCGVAQVPGLGVGGPDLPSGALGILTSPFESGDADATFAAVTDTPDGATVTYEDGIYEWFAQVADERAPAWKDVLRISAFRQRFRPIDHLAAGPGSPIAVGGARRHAHPARSGPAHRHLGAERVGRRDRRSPLRCLRAREFAASAGPTVGWFRRQLTGWPAGLPSGLRTGDARRRRCPYP